MSCRHHDVGLEVNYLALSGSICRTPEPPFALKGRNVEAVVCGTEAAL